MSDRRHLTFTFPAPWILFIIFLVLQLTGHIDWPWYAIAAPLLIPLGLMAVIMLVAFVIASVISYRSNRLWVSSVDCLTV